MPIRIDHSQVTSFARQLQGVPADLRRELRPHIKSAAERVADEVRGRASWSSRIPAATKTKVSFGSRTGVMVYVDQAAAPHARPLTFPNNGSANRHPVYGTSTWVNQPARPFFMEAIAASEGPVVQEIQKAIDAALGRVF